MITTNLSGVDRHYLMTLAFQIAQSSGCVSRKVGAVISLGPNFVIAAPNDMPKGLGKCEDKKLCRCFNPDREPGKDLDKVHAIHAEAAVIAYAAKRGHKVDGTTMFVTDLPCTDCAKLVIEAGIKHVIYERDYPGTRSPEMFEEAGVTLEQYRRDLSECD